MSTFLMGWLIGLLSFVPLFLGTVFVGCVVCRLFGRRP
jgi:hypothetical protein